MSLRIVADPSVPDTPRRYPRTLRQAFPHEANESAMGIHRIAVIKTRPPLLVRLLRALFRR